MTATFRRRALAAAALVILLLAAALIAAWLPLRAARAAWLQGRDNDAVAQALNGARFHLWSGQYHQLLGAAYLTSGDVAAAQPHLAAIGTLHITAVSKDDVARRLFARERYANFLTYDAASHDARESADVTLYRAAALLGTNRLADAQRAFAAVDRAHAYATRYAMLQRALAARASGAVPWVLDRNGGTIAVVREHDAVATDSAFAPLVDRAAGNLTFGALLPRLGGNASVETTLDPFVQHAAVQALGSYRGALVAIDPRTNEILAVASSRGTGAVANLALERQYEPGSVVKVLTSLNVEEHGPGLASMFPYDCKGALEIDGRRFGDWVPAGHGLLRSVDDALAVSCNIFFGDAGLRIGAQRLTRFMTAAGFGQQASLGIFDVPLGKIIGPIATRYDTAFLAIGLEHETINALHVAMLASMMANRGTLTTPTLLVRRRSILGDVVALPPKQGTTRLASARAAEVVIHAMQAVASDPKGTGHRAEVAGVSLAMKTGTAGERKTGLEALILAFAPVESPRIAFGIIGEDAGPAEFAGAKIAHDFVEAMQPRLK